MNQDRGNDDSSNIPPVNISGHFLEVGNENEIFMLVRQSEDPFSDRDLLNQHRFWDMYIP